MLCLQFLFPLTPSLHPLLVQPSRMILHKMCSTLKSTLLALILLTLGTTPSWGAEEDKAASASASAAAAASAAAQTTVGAPPPGPPPPHPAAGGFGLGGLGALFPGLGFNKHLNLDAGAGFGPFGLGGGAGVPPPPPAAAPVLEGLGLGGGSPFGLLGPSYIPSTWIGSALGAKGDLLFPLVIFVFFVVGVWTIVQFLLGLIVPLIAAKLSVLNEVTHVGEDRKWRRQLTPQEQKDQDIQHLTQVVWAAFENFGCMKTSACYSGNMLHTLAGGKDKVKEYEGLLDTVKIMDKEIVEIFKRASTTGKEDCSLYPCQPLDKKVGAEEENINSVHSV